MRTVRDEWAAFGSQLRDFVRLFVEVLPWWWWMVSCAILELAVIAHRLGRIAEALEAALVP
ncbi:MAG: hypothetical protein GY898_23125 [Proteobacteria bacterium]|nr:hypothetical protein [Pseudomonadota bacterium]